MATPEKRLDAVERAVTPPRTEHRVVWGNGPEVREEVRRLQRTGIDVLHVVFEDEGDQRPAA